MTRILIVLALVAGSVLGQDQDTNAYYKLGPDSVAQEGVPKGKIHGPFVLPSKVFPGDQHDYWIYVPAQYEPSTPAALMVYNDGQAYMHPESDIRAQNVMDNLIYRREIPVMIGVFINPGRKPEQPMAKLDNWGDRGSNRPEEYNSLDDRYARVIVEELLPVLQSQYNISSNPEHRGIGGSSSGAIAAFTVAWERPNEFRKVLSLIGTYVNLRGRGGSRYPDLVRDTPRKPLRIFLQDGRNDHRGRRGDNDYKPELDWFYQNVRLAKELTEKGYDVNYVWGIGPHSSKHGGMILPDMMRWLWRDHPVSTYHGDTEERGFFEAAGR
jgi:enterochelin esterase-like enzyme